MQRSGMLRAFQRFRSTNTKPRNVASFNEEKLHNVTSNIKNVLDKTKNVKRKISSIDDFKNLHFVKEYAKLNPGIDINLNYEDIKSSSNKKYYQTYIKPSKDFWNDYLLHIPATQDKLSLVDEWNPLFNKLYNVPMSNDFFLKMNELRELLVDKQKCTTIETPKMAHLMVDWLQNIVEPMRIGDICVLNSQNNDTNNAINLVTCVELPNNLKDPRYTFAGMDGSICFEYKNNVLLKLPSVINLGASSNGKKEIDQNSQLYNVNKADANVHGYYKSEVEHKYSVPVTSRQLLISNIQNFYLKCSTQLQNPIDVQMRIFYKEYCQQQANASNNTETPFQVSFLDIVQKLQKKLIPSSLLKSTKNNSVSSAIVLGIFQNMFKNKHQFFGEFQYDKASLAPISITFIPQEYTKKMDQNLLLVMNGQETNTSNVSLIQHFAANWKSSQDLKTVFEVQKYLPILEILNAYLNGNLINKFASNVIADIGKALNLDDVSKDSIFKVLQQIYRNTNLQTNEQQKLLLANPLLANHDLNIYSKSRELENAFYNSITMEDVTLDGNVTTFQDETNLIEFSDPVYCIDSETAHEIDDGVAIRHIKGDKYTLYVHIAHPARFLLPSNKTYSDVSFPSQVISKINPTIKAIFEIAKKRSFTTYLPELTVPMLPETFVQKHDLRNETARSLCFQIDFEFTHSFLKKADGKNLEEQSCEKGLILHHKTFKVVENYQLTNLPKKIHYSVVDKILNGEEVPGIDVCKHKENIKKLFELSSLLKEKRVEEGNAVVFGEGFNKGLPKMNIDTKTIEFQDGESTKSTLLVSELMILANSLAGRFLAKNKIPAIYRVYTDLAISRTLEFDNKSIQKSGKNQKTRDPTIADVVLYSSILNSSTYSLDYSKGQSMMGVDHYATVTSPLRRFPDIINHLQILSFLKSNRKTTYYSAGELQNMLYNNILPRYLILKNMSSKIQKFWTLNYWREMFTNSGKPFVKCPIIITSVPKFNQCGFASLGYKFATGKVHLKKNQHFNVGQVIDNCTVTKLDAINNTLEVEIDVQKQESNRQN
ncbi:hypothetical protein ACO0RG_003029 [Hanseniaspora osmophila]